MDYHSMKRRELQALCKEHDIPANSANSVMADKLSQLLNEKQKPRARQRTCMKSSVDATDESEPAVLRMQAKKVRFSPDVDLLGSELRSGKKRKTMVTDMKVRRKSVANKVDNDDNVELVDDAVQVPARLTRSRVQTVGKDGVVPSNEKKQVTRAVKKTKVGTDGVKGTEGNLGKITRSKVHTLGKGCGVQFDKNKLSKGAVNDVEKSNESVEEKLVSRVRVTRSKAQTMIEDGMGPDQNPQVKKRSGRRVAKDAENVDPPKDSMDIPARVTRARGQTLTDDSGNTVADPQAEKKRTRSDTRGADLSNKSSNVAPDDNQELLKRKSLRNRSVDIADEGEKLGHGRQKKRSEETIAKGSESQHHADKGLRQSKRNKSKVEVSTVLNQKVSKVESVNERNITRSRAPLTMKSSGVNNKRDLDNNLEEKLEHAGRRNSQRISVIQPEKTEVVLRLEEPVKRQSRKDTKRKPVMQKTEGKEFDEPLDGKREIEKENEMVRSPNSAARRTVGRKQSEEQHDNHQGLDIKGSVTRSGKTASENEMKTVVGAAGSQKSRKRRGDFIIEDHIIETQYVSPVEGSPRRSTRSASKREVEFVTHPRQTSGEKQENNLKTSATRMDNTSKKRVKLSGTKQSDSKDHAEKSNTKGTPVSKLKNFAVDENVIEPKPTPVIDKSVRRFTRSAIRSDKNAVGSSLGKVDGKKLSQSAIKDQHIGDAQRASRNVAKFRRDPVLNTAPGRFTRSGIKHAGNAGPVRSEVSKGAKGRILEHSSEVSDSDSERPPIKVVEENSISMGETFTVTENVNSVSGEIAIGVDSYATERAFGKEITEVPFAHIEKSSTQSTQNPTKHETSAKTPYLIENLLGEEQQNPVNLPNFEDGTPSGTFLSDTKRTPLSTAKVSENEIDAPSDGSHLQNQDQSQEVYVKSAIFGEAEVQEAVDSEKSVLKSVRPEVDEKEMESTKSGSSPMGLQDVMVEEPLVLVGKNDVMEITNNNYGDACYAGSSAVCHVPFEQSDVKKKSEELEAPLEPPTLEAVNQLIADDGAEQDALTSNDTLQNISLGEHEVAENSEHNDEDKTASVADGITATEVDSVVGEYDMEPNKDGDMEQSPGDDNLQGLAMDEKEIEDEVVSALDRRNVADGIDAHEVDFEVQEYDMEPNRDNALERSTGDDMLQGLAMDEEEIKDGVITAQDRFDVADGIDAHEMDSVAGQYDVEPYRDDALEQSAGDDKLQGFVFDENEFKDDLVTAQDRCDIADNVLDAGKELAKEVEFEVVPSAGTDVQEILILGKTDGEDENVNDIKEGEADSLPLTAASMLDDSVLSGGDGEDESGSANKEHESSPMLSTDKGGFDTSFLGKIDDFNMNRQVESDVLETPFSDIGVDGKDDVEVEGSNMHTELEPVSEPFNAINTLEVPVSGNDVEVEHVIGDKGDEKEGGSEQNQEQDRLTRNDSPVVNRHDIGYDAPEPSHSENMAVVPEVLFASSDEEPEPMLNVSVDVCASVGQSDSVTSKETPQTPATSGNNVTAVRFDALESKLDIYNDDDVLGQEIVVMDTENDVGNEQKIMRTSELDEGVLSLESEGISVDMSNEQIIEEGKPTTENDHQQIIATVDHDSDGDKVVEDHSNHGPDESDSQLLGIIKDDENPTGEKSSPIMFRKEDQLMGDIGGQESLVTEEHLPITYKNEEPLVDDMVSDLPTVVRDGDRNNQEKSQNTSSYVDWGNYSFRIDEFQKPVSANEGEDVLDEQDADFQTSARANSFFIQESSSLAVDFVDSVTNLDKASSYVADGKSNQDVDMLKEAANADVSGKVSSSPDSSLKALLTTPATARISHVINSGENAFSFAFHDDSCDNDVDKNGTAAHDFNHQWENEPSSVSNDENQGYATQNTNSNLEDFDDKEADGSGKEHFEFEDDQVKQHDLLTEAAGTHHHDDFGLNDDLLHGSEFGIKEPVQPEVSETGDESAVNRGIGEI